MPEAFGTGQYGLNFVGGLWFMANQKIHFCRTLKVGTAAPSERAGWIVRLFCIIGLYDCRKHFIHTAESRLLYNNRLCKYSFGWFYLRVRIEGSLPFYFTDSNKTQLKIKRECAGNGAGKGQPRTGERGEHQAAEGILGLAGTWKNPS